MLVILRHCINVSDLRLFIFTRERYNALLYSTFTITIFLEKIC